MGRDGESLRVYGGVGGEQRRLQRREQLIGAGLDILGGAEDPAGLTVRGVCRRAGLATRYFYESFADRDELTAAVFDHVVGEIAEATLAAVDAAPPRVHDRVQSGLATIVAKVGDDPRSGRVLFSPALSTPVLIDRRVVASSRFARLLLGEAQEFFDIEADDRLEVVTGFLVGGLAQVLAAWLRDEVSLDERALVEQLSELFLGVVPPHERGPGLTP